jgi:predicted metalloprotease
MKLDDLRESGNVQDRRSGGGRGGLALGGMGTILVAVVLLVMGKGPQEILSLLMGAGPQTVSAPASPEQEEMVTFVRKVLGSTEDVWTAEFQKLNRSYDTPSLEIFTNRTQSGCGLAGSEMGPFYCPADEKIYIDLSFYQELRDRFGAPGDFAQAYVIAHEVGHHVQNELGLTAPLEEARARGASQSEQNALSVRLELQADFLAGLWARKQDDRNKFLEPGDIEEAMRCAQQIGDDALQKQAQGRVVPDSFTHGTSAQRMRWFMKGYESGDIRQGDTFRARDL